MADTIRLEKHAESNTQELGEHFDQLVINPDMAPNVVDEAGSPLPTPEGKSLCCCIDGSVYSEGVLAQALQWYISYFHVFSVSDSL